MTRYRHSASRKAEIQRSSSRRHGHSSCLFRRQRRETVSLDNRIMLRNPSLTVTFSIARRQAVKQRNVRLPRSQRGTRILPSRTPTNIRSYASAAARATVGSTPTVEAAPVLRDLTDVPVKLEGDDPNSRYESSVRNGVLRDDDHQRSVVNLLQGLHGQLKDYTPVDVPPSHGSSGWVSPQTL